MSTGLAFLVLVSTPWRTAGSENPGQDSLPSAEGPEVVLDLPWGSGGVMAGRVDGSESASTGPMSFALSPSGEVYIVDQVNTRIMKFYADAAPAGDIALPAPNVVDIGVSPGGALVLLDRVDRQSLIILDERTGATREVPVIGEGIQEGGLVTAMFVEDDGVWLEVFNLSLVRVLDGSLQPVERTIVPGRKAQGAGGVLGAELDALGGARLWLQDPATGVLLAGRDIRFDHRIDRIIWIDGDDHGGLYAFFHLMEFGDREPYPAVFEEVAGVRLDGKLVPTGSFKSPYTIKEWWQYKEFVVDGGGRVYQMAFTDQGVRILRWRWNG